MGRIFLEQMSGARLFNCRRCGTNLTAIQELISTNFFGITGRAYLFNRVINVNHDKVCHRTILLTGLHYIRFVSCKVCKTILGWYYEHASHESERYKEGKTVLELKLLHDVRGLRSEDFSLDEDETAL